MPSSEIDPITKEVLQRAVHDLKGPANRLRLLSQLLSRSLAMLDEDTRKLLSHIQDSATEVDAVTEGLRTFAEVCTRALHVENLDLNEALAAALAKLRPTVEKSGTRVTSTRLPAVTADRFLITCLFQELLANAIRFSSGDKPAVSISCAGGDEGGWFVSVADNGPGVECGMEERIFRPFHKLSGGQGAGIGLTVCRKIVDLHGGRIWLEPRPGGADFRFFLGGGGCE
ncbi:MAG: ATP-binding protein [Bryobacteraceae bacterium]